MRGGRFVNVDVSADGAGLVSHAGTALLAQVADRLGLTGALSAGLAGLKQRDRGHDPGRVIRDLAVMIASGGECVADLAAVRDQEALFGAVASDSTAFRVIDRIASEGLLDVLRGAHARARQRFWELHGAPESLTIDVDATLITSHSEKELAAGNYKGGYGFHPLMSYADQTREALGALLRPGNAGANTATDHKTVLDLALGQLPVAQIEGLEILVRADRAGATHELADYCRDAGMRFSFGYDLTDTVRQSILQTPTGTWVPALDQDGSERENGEVVEITDSLCLGSWPGGSRVIVRRERPHPGAQLSFTDVDGYRFQAILTDQPGENIAILECRHRQRARVEDRIRDDKDTGLAKFPFREFKLNAIWLQLVLLAHDLIVWTQALLLDGELAAAQPKRLRYRLLHVAARLAFSGRGARLRLQHDWPWAGQLQAAFQRLKTLPAPSG
ncbi:MAG: IS1380 family transposase [Solirubrobacteraceae bacterium]